MAPDADFAPKYRGVMTHEEARELNPLVLAYIGDGVQMLYLRARYAASSHAKAGKLHVLVSAKARATAQAKAADALADVLTPEEAEVFRRGRNSHSGSSAKNASIVEYRKASGLEAVFGYLYLTGADARLEELLRLSAEEDRSAT